MNVWGITDRGVIREQNQDAFAHQVLPDGRVLALVCDGMGGARAGNVASTLAVDMFMAGIPGGRGRGGVDRSRMHWAAAAANRPDIFHRPLMGRMDCAGMGTTLVAALAEPHETLILNEGDSRAYHLSRRAASSGDPGPLLVEDLVERGELTPGSGPHPPAQEPDYPGPGGRAELRVDCVPPADGGGGLPAAVQRRLEQRSVRPGVPL